MILSLYQISKNLNGREEMLLFIDTEETSLEENETVKTLNNLSSEENSLDSRCDAA